MPPHLALITVVNLCIAAAWLPSCVLKTEQLDPPPGLQGEQGEPGPMGEPGALGVCPSNMVSVGDFCVDKYEALIVSEDFYNDGACDGTCVEGSNCFGSGGSANPADNYPATFPDNGNWTVPLYACSVEAVIPSRMMTWFQASQACANAGKHLITNAEWQTAAAGTPDDQASCNISTTAPEANGNRADCVSAHGVLDMVGNLFEWTANWFVTGVPWQMADGDSTNTAWPASYGDDAIWNLNGRTQSDPAGYVDGLPATALRGGYWGVGPAGGVFALLLNHGPSHRFTTIGFRCARGR
ncbi:SUMF1/EgtB/PvdO family nonheme iron enzyme [Desulfobulbus sp. AH-315-M07]|nr:SUMF1/EgtB/PvdO family nonheme iron enzyme [Desulfobulbus sp. AH-315-M07]